MAFAMALNYAEMCQIWFHSLNTKIRLNTDLHIKFEDEFNDDDDDREKKLLSKVLYIFF